MSDKENDQSTLTREVNPRKSFAQEVLEAALERERLGKERKEKLTNNKPETLLRRAGSSGKEATSDDNKKRKPRKSFRDKAAKFKAGTEKKEEKKTRTKTKISGKKKTDEKETGGRISKLKEQLSNLVRQSEQLAKDIARFEKDLLGKDQPAKKVGRPRKIRIESSDTNLVQSPKLESDGDEKPAENVDSEVDRGRQIIESFKRSLAVGERTKHLCRVRQPAAAAAAEVVKDDAAASNQQLEPSCFAERGPVQLVVIRPMREKDLAEKLPIAPASSAANEKIAGQSKSIPLGGENKSELPAIELPGSPLEATVKPDDVSIVNDIRPGQESANSDAKQTEPADDLVLPTDSVVVGEPLKQNGENSSSDDVDLGLVPIKSVTTSLKGSLDHGLGGSVSGGRKYLRGRADLEPELPERRQEVILGRNRFRARNGRKKGESEELVGDSRAERKPRDKKASRDQANSFPKKPIADSGAEKNKIGTEETVQAIVPSSDEPGGSSDAVKLISEKLPDSVINSGTGTKFEKAVTNPTVAQQDSSIREGPNLNQEKKKDERTPAIAHARGVRTAPLAGMKNPGNNRAETQKIFWKNPKNINGSSHLAVFRKNGGWTGEDVAAVYEKIKKNCIGYCVIDTIPSLLFAKVRGDAEEDGNLYAGTLKPTIYGSASQMVAEMGYSERVSSILGGI